MKQRIVYLSVAAVLIVVTVYLLYRYAVNGFLYINAEDAKTKIASGEISTLVDARTNLEYGLGHASGAIHLPIDEMEQKAAAVLPDKTAPILVYSESYSARDASEKLYSLGYKKVRYISGTYLTLR
jgi:rhodanese-related sulfurtransferase